MNRPSRDFRRFSPVKATAVPEEPVDYKNLDFLANYLSPQFRILSRKRTGFRGKYQKQLKLAIKRARFLALLPYSS